MFGQSKPVPFDPYRRSRSRRRVPRWLLLLLTGIALGIGGVVLVQERYLPPRLSADATTKLRSAFDEADAERLRLKGELADTSKRLQATLAEKKTLADQLAASQSTTERLRLDLASVVASLPPDPRGAAVEVRSGRFTAKGGQLAYDVVLTRERASGQPMTGVMQLVITGDSARGAEVSLNPQSVSVSLGSHEVVRGNMPLPEGFKPRQATVQVLDRSGNKALGMRVLLVK
jgi:hypothetical protein